MNAIEINKLSYQYPGADKAVLHNIALEVEKGDFLAVVGNNGCGKSTLCKTLNGLIPHFIAGEMEGRVLVNGTDTVQSDVGELARHIGYVYQDFENQIVCPTVLEDASYSCMNYAMKDYKERGRKALLQCGLEEKEKDYIWQLSGGQTHLLALAGAVSLQPDILVLDEPIAQLDPRHADQVYSILKDLNENYGKTIIVIEHHTEYIADFCKHVLLLKNGQVQWKLPVKEALCRVEELQECNIFPPQVTVAAYRLQKEVQNADTIKKGSLPITIKQGKEFFEKWRCERETERAEQTKRCETVGEKQEKAPEAVDFRNVSVSYRSVKGEPIRIFDKLNLHIGKGEKIALIGSNGAGKSTLMKLMTGLIKPEEGEVLLKGKDVQGIRTELLSRQVSLVYQNPEEMFIKDSIENDIAYAMQVREVENWKERTAELLERFHLTELRQRDGRLLSGGQMRRASLAIGVALRPEILLLDEPTANLDIATRKEIMRTLNDLKEITETVLIATHDMQLVCEWAERIIVLCSGKVIADGSRNEIFANRMAVEAAGIRPPEIFSMAQELDANALCYTIDEFLEKFKRKGAEEWNG